MSIYLKIQDYQRNCLVQEQLGYLNQTFEESLGLLEETNAAVEMNKYGAMVDFNGIDIELVGPQLRLFILWCTGFV